MGVCGLVDRALDSKDQKVWGSIPSTGHVQTCRANFVFHTASVHPAVMGAWCTDPRLDQYS